jgi:colicin import membrane protein
VRVRRWIGNSAWLFGLACGASVAAHLYFAHLLLSFRSQASGVAAPPTEAISVNIETTDILNSPEEDEQTQNSKPADYVPPQEEVKPVEEKPEETAPPPELEQTVKVDEAPEDTDKKRLEEEERQRLAEEEALRVAEQAEKERLAEEALRKAEKAEQQRIAEEARRKVEEEAERKRVEEAERQREELYRLAEESRRQKREAERREEERRKREQAERIAEEEARKRRERRDGQNAAAASQGKQSSKGRVSASRGSILNYRAVLSAYVTRNKPPNPGAGRGVTKISFVVTASGGVASARVARSSGKSPLDQAAVSNLRRIAPLPRPPEGATPAQLSFTLEITFE